MMLRCPLQLRFFFLVPFRDRACEVLDIDQVNDGVHRRTDASRCSLSVEQTFQSRLPLCAACPFRVRIAHACRAHACPKIVLGQSAVVLQSSIPFYAACIGHLTSKGRLVCSATGPIDRTLGNSLSYPMARRFLAKVEVDAMRSDTERLVSEQSDRCEALRDNIAFFIAGLLNNLFFTLYLSAAEDLIQNSAGVILMFNVLPGLMIKMLLPLFAHNLSYSFRVSLTSFGLCTSCLAVAFIASTPVRLAGIGLSSCAGTLGEVTFLSLSSRYRPSTIGSWSSGTGLAGLSGSFIYHFLRAVLGLSSRQAILLVAPLSLGMLISFACVLTPSRGEEAYAPVPSAEDGHGDALSSTTDNVAPGYEPVVFETPLPGRSLRRTALPWLLRAYIIPLMLVYFFEYVINQGISPTLDSFTSDIGKSPVGPSDRNHLYTLYQIAYQSGVFVSRSSIEVIMFPHIWLLPFVQFGNCAVLLIGALLQNFPHRYVVFGIMFFEGLVGGAMYVNSFYKLRRTAPKEVKAWALGAAGVGDALGITFAACVNIFLECGIRRLRGEACVKSLREAERK